jgi:GDPmannose 4,6-dehydratase
MGKVALITGIGGQDGSYLAEFLLAKDYKVVGIVRRCSVNNLDRIKDIQDKLVLVEGDIADAAFINQVISRYQPDEVYNLAAMSHVGSSFASPSSTFMMDAIGPLNILEAVRCFSKHSKVYQASTSELFGSNVSSIWRPDYYAERYDGERKDAPSECTDFFQDECTPFSPNSPYAVAKLAAHNLIRLYRESYGIYSCAGILFNHESPRRGENFVTRKITKWIGQYKQWQNQEFKTIGRVIDDNNFIFHGIPQHGPQQFPKLRLGNIDAYRDWGHAKDYVRAMWMMMQQDKPDDFVISTDVAYTVRNFLEEAFKAANLDSWENYVVIDPSLYRPCEVPYLCGKSDKARNILGWKPEYTFKKLVEDMVANDLNG